MKILLLKVLYWIELLVSDDQLLYYSLDALAYSLQILKIKEDQSLGLPYHVL